MADRSIDPERKWRRSKRKSRRSFGQRLSPCSAASQRTAIGKLWSVASGHPQNSRRGPLWDQIRGIGGTQPSLRPASPDGCDRVDL